MTSITFEMKKDKDSVNLTANEVDQEHVGDLINGIFNLFAPIPTVTTPVQNASAISPWPISVNPIVANTEEYALDEALKDFNSVSLTLTTPETIEPVKHVHNAIPVHGEPATMEEAMSEEPKDIEDYMKTGIKIKNGINHYRCRYICPKCGCKGNHYIPEGVQTVDCHDCQASLEVKKAVSGVPELSQPDKYTNWYVAGKQWQQLSDEAERTIQNRFRK